MRGREAGHRPDSLTVLFASGDTGTPLPPSPAGAPTPMPRPPFAPLSTSRAWRRPGRAGLAALGLGLTLLAGAACGKRGAPLAPLPRVPAAVQTFAALRRGDAVELTVLVPASNAAGDQPGDIGRVEVYALTAVAAPRLETGRIPGGAVLVASSPVRRPLPPAPPLPAGTPPVPLPPGVDQGASVAFSETLTPAALRATETPVVRGASEDPTVPGPIVFERPELVLKRHYMAAAVSRGGRRGAWSTVRSVPVAPPSGAPSAPVLTYDATGYHLTWTPAPDAWQAPPPAVDLLESRPLGTVRPPTRYNVYAADAAGTPSGAPLASESVAAPAFDVAGVTFDAERCFVVRGVDTFDGVAIEGPASPPGCETARDTFPPPAPTALEAVGGAGVISLIWEGVEAPDLAGYLVLRGEAGGEPGTVLTPAPITARSFEDKQVTPGTRYVYVVVAIDSATPANRSAPSNRAEEVARQ